MVYPLLPGFFVDDTSHFSVTHDSVIIASDELNCDLARIKQWAISSYYGK